MSGNGKALENGRARQGHNGGPPLDDGVKERIRDQIVHDKHQWERDMHSLTMRELNERWHDALAKMPADERKRFEPSLKRLTIWEMKLLYSRLCDLTSADPDNSPREAWPTETQLANAMGLRDESTVRRLVRRLEVLGFVYTNRNRTPPRTHYRIQPPNSGKDNPRFKSGEHSFPDQEQLESN